MKLTRDAKEGVLGLRAPALSIKLVALFAAALALLALTIIMPTPARALSAGDVVVPVHGKLSDGGTFKGKIINPNVSYNADRDILKVSLVSW